MQASLEEVLAETIANILTLSKAGPRNVTVLQLMSAVASH